MIVVFSAVCEWILPGDFAILWVSNAECGWDAGRSKRGDATDGSLAARTGENPKRTAARSEERRHTPQLRICISTVFAGAKNDDADANDVCLTANEYFILSGAKNIIATLGSNIISAFGRYIIATKGSYIISAEQMPHFEHSEIHHFCGADASFRAEREHIISALRNTLPYH